jgi:hypothetical protein
VANIDDVLSTVINNELRLLSPRVRRSTSEVERLLHPDFFEFGASGRRWTRSAMVSAIGELLTDDGGPRVDQVEATRLDDSVVLVTYLAQEPERYTRRSSLWRRTADGTWQLYFHQGTPIPGKS